MSTIFRPEGPFQVHRFKGPRSALVDAGSAARFWTEHPELAHEMGCYIFGARAGKGIVPLYVGQSKTTFKTECFTHHKLHRYNRALAERRIGTPVLFFLVKEQGSSACIDDVESFLIQNAVVKNPDLANVHRKAWSITGVLRSGKGPRSSSARHLRRLLGLDTGSESRPATKSPASEPTKVRRHVSESVSSALTAAPTEGPRRGSGESTPVP